MSLSTDELEVRKQCAEALEQKPERVHVLARWAQMAVMILRESGVKVCAVIEPDQISEAIDAVGAGVQEIGIPASANPGPLQILTLHQSVPTVEIRIVDEARG